MNRSVRLGTTVLALAVSFSLVTAARQAPMEPAVDGISAEDYLSQQKSLHAWLMEEMPAGTREAVFPINLTEDERAELRAAQEEKAGPAVVGRTKGVSQAIRFSDLESKLIGKAPSRVGNAVLQQTDDGGFVWAMAIRSEGASALRIHLTQFDLPGEVDLYLFSERGQAFGPYQRRGPHDDREFWTHTVEGDEAILLLRHYGPAGRADLGKTSFRIADVGHIGPGLPDGVAALRSFCSFNATCVENAECENAGGSAGDQAQHAVALMQWISGAFIRTCTGGLIADTDTGSQIRYFLTANHCLSRGKDAKNLETYFQYTVSCGTSNCPAQTTQPGSIQVLGSSIKSSSTNGDHTLLELKTDDPLPSNAVFLGWTTSAVANSNETSLQRISHPSWAPQAYSSHQVDTGAGTCSGFPRGEFIYSRDTSGATEGGSSGAPLWNAAGEIVGQLFGACGTNLNDTCDNQNNATVDGAFAHYFPQVESFLDPGTSCNSSPEVCNDGTDNDCDGATDCADSDCNGDPSCGGGGCQLGQPGDSCDSNSDCCSNKCKGPPSNRTCR